MEQLFVRPVKAGRVRSCGCREGVALDNCFGFIDGTVRTIRRPVPSGMIAQIYGPVGKCQFG